MRPAPDPHFLIVVTPPYSGSTALAQLLKTSRGSAFLHAKGEGQWLLPGMCGRDRWDPGMAVDWESVRAVWMHRVQMLRALVHGTELIIEKSPPNMVRMDRLLETFPRHTVMAYNRNPFASSASILFRRHDPESKTQEERLVVLRRLAENWLIRARLVRQWAEEPDVPAFTYEQFCADPGRHVAELAALVPALGTADVDAMIEVKDYGKAQLANQNARQIALLSPLEIEALSKVFATDPDLLAYFGYEPAPPA